MSKRYSITVRGGFSERKKIKSLSNVLQLEDLNERTRNKLYNRIVVFIQSISDKEFREKLLVYIYTDIFSMTIDEIPYNEFGYGIGYGDVFDTFKEIFVNNNYNEIFDFIDGIIQGIIYEDGYPYIKEEFIDSINEIFTKENVGYRIMNDVVTDLMDENTIRSIDETIQNPYNVVVKHYSKAVEKLFKERDYENSIKESICSVEAMCQVINGSKEGLNVALKNLKITIHPALKEGYIKLYGYTSDENGTRHANGIGEKDATYEEAKYMLVSCSAFVNYLKDIYEAYK